MSITQALVAPRYRSEISTPKTDKSMRAIALDTETVVVPRSAGVPRIRLHDLRHTHATHALQAGIHTKVVSERLGHSSIAITLDPYSHVIPTLQEPRPRSSPR
jgi:integrase